MKELFNIPDYDTFYEGFNEGGSSGMNECHIFRFEGIPSDPRVGGRENIKMHYKEDVRALGYLPR